MSTRISQLVLVALVAILSLALVAPAAAQPSTAKIAGPLAASGNPNYFKDATGAVLTLNGSQTWNTLQDWGSNGSPQTLDFDAFVKFLTAHGHNFTLLWRTEMPKFCGLPTTAGVPPDFWAGPHPWRRTYGRQGAPHRDGSGRRQTAGFGHWSRSRQDFTGRRRPGQPLCPSGST